MTDPRLRPQRLEVDKEPSKRRPTHIELLDITMLLNLGRDLSKVDHSKFFFKFAHENTRFYYFKTNLPFGDFGR